MRIIGIAVCAMCGGFALSHGAKHASHGWIAIALILLCVSLGLVIDSHPVGRIARNNVKAIWYALIIRRLLRRGL